MPINPDVRLFLRDLALILGLPALAVTGLLAWWRPWEHFRPPAVTSFERAYEARRAAERRARAEGIHRVDWHGLRLDLPRQYVLTVDEPVLELIEQDPAEHTDNDHWPAQAAFVELDSAARARFADARTNCVLAPDRCWSEHVGTHQLRCQRSAGVPDPAVSWTPHLECHVPDMQVRLLVNAPPAVEAGLLALFRSALAPHNVRPR